MISIDMNKMRRDTVNAVVDDLLPSMSQETRKILTESLVGRRVDKGGIILAEGEVANSIIFVGSGMVRQYYYKNKRDVTEHFTYEGQMLASLESLFKRTPSHIIVEAIEASVIFEFMWDDIQRLVDNNPEINLFYRKMLELGLIISQKKADSWRFETAKDRYLRLLKTHPEIVKRAPMIMIASYLLMTPETLSRIRSDI